MYGSRCSARPWALYTLSTKSISIHHSQSTVVSQFLYTTLDREIGAKISVSISISRFLRLDNVLYKNCSTDLGKRHTRCETSLYVLIVAHHHVLISHSLGGRAR